MVAVARKLAAIMHRLWADDGESVAAATRPWYLTPCSHTGEYPRFTAGKRCPRGRGSDYCAERPARGLLAESSARLRLQRPAFVPHRKATSRQTSKLAGLVLSPSCDCPMNRSSGGGLGNQCLPTVNNPRSRAPNKHSQGCAHHPYSRLLMARRVAAGEKIVKVAADFCVSPQTCANGFSAGERGGAGALQDRTSRAHRLRNMTGLIPC